MSAFLYGVLADILEWLLTKGFAIIGQDFQAWMAQRKSDAALTTNETNLQNAVSTGDPTNVENAGQDSLNNNGGT